MVFVNYRIYYYSLSPQLVPFTPSGSCTIFPIAKTKQHSCRNLSHKSKRDNLSSYIYFYCPSLIGESAIQFNFNEITLTLFYVKSNINVSCLDSTVIDVKAKRRHESRSLYGIVGYFSARRWCSSNSRPIFRSKMIKVPSKFVRTFPVNFMGERAFKLQNKAAKDAKHENTIFTTTAILFQREARQVRGDSWLVSADICGSCSNFRRKPS